jgi:hypothetical protein
MIQSIQVGMICERSSVAEQFKVDELKCQEKC